MSLPSTLHGRCTMGSFVVGMVGLALAACATARADERDDRPVPSTQPAPALPPYPWYASPEEGDLPVPDWLDYDSEPPYDFHERNWRYRMRNYRGNRFSRDYYAPFGRYRGKYDLRNAPRPPYADGPYDYGYAPGYPPSAYGYGYGYDDPGGYGFDEGYYQGHRDGRRFADWEQRQQLGTTSYLEAMKNGLAAFRNGDYSTAARQFILAANLNQGDPAARLHTGHTLVALGRYAEAALAVRRAIQLQPKLVYLSLDIRSDYGRPDDFEQHYQKLKEATEKTDADADLWFLLGYYQFFSNRGAEAYRSLQRADALDPGGRTTIRLLDAARLSTPAEPIPPPKPAPEPDKGKQPQGESV